MIKIINYGLGNVNAFLNIYKSLGIDCEISSSFASLKDASKLILPGVGSFDWAMEKLTASGMHEIINELVLEKKIPILGVCVGMQIMANSSEEGDKKGLGWIKGKNIHLSKISNEKKKFPHMGWNQVEITNSLLFKDIINPKFYFLHSFYIDLEDKKEAVGYANYGSKFPCAISQNNIFGVQFHPEKSHNWGIQLLKNFSKIDSTNVKK